jgi:predicted nuclease with TOPRIM domain
MAKIPFQPQPKVPPIGFFEPISVDPKDMMTDVEYLLGILKKLNSMIAQLNANTEFIEKYSGKIEEIEAEMQALRLEMEQFEDDVNRQINDRFTQIKLELQSMVAAALVQANAYTDAVAAQLENEIQQISVGNITLYDPTTGIISPLQVVIDNIYGTSREDALTATEYDALQLTATAYDAYAVSAFDYDMYGKTLLV